MNVDTPMLRRSMHGSSIADDVLTTEAVAGVVVEGLPEERFLILPHPEVLQYMQRKTSDYDRCLRGMGRLHRGAARAVNLTTAATGRRR